MPNTFPMLASFATQILVLTQFKLQCVDILVIHSILLSFVQDISAVAIIQSTHRRKLGDLGIVLLGNLGGLDSAHDVALRLEGELSLLAACVLRWAEAVGLMSLLANIHNITSCIKSLTRQKTRKTAALQTTKRCQHSLKLIIKLFLNLQ